MTRLLIRDLMQHIISIFKRLFGANAVKVIDFEDSALKQIDNRVVADHSHGNVYLQEGRHFTEKDVDAEIKQLSKIQF